MTPRNGTYYALYVCDTKGCCSCGHYKTEKDAIKAMDEAANKINAAQGFKHTAKEKVTMKYVEHNDKTGIGVYCCSHCKMRLHVYGFYNFCPYCGEEIERWEE